ncbi:MAG: cysteine desulfurase family protein [Acidobacteriota bacterium]
MNRYYFDHNATTPVSPEALEALLPTLTEVYGNASSIHHFGQAARQKLDEARKQVTVLLGANPDEIVFTSGGTESDNLAILGAAHQGHVITTTIEHPAVLSAAAQLADATQVPVDGRGLVDPDDIRKALRPGTTLISVMHANNELGTIQPIAEIARIAAEAGMAFHSDGVQAIGRFPVNVRALGVGLYSISGHKFGAPKGIGALYVRKGTRLQARQFGGRHERERRAGTENVGGAVALARAAQWVVTEGVAEAHRVEVLRDRLEQSILERIANTCVNGCGVPRIPNTTNIRFDGIDSDALLIALDLRGFAVSSGAACSSGAPEPSHVLLAIGLTREQARSSIRFSLGRNNTLEQVDALVDAVTESVAHLRKLSPVYV